MNFSDIIIQRQGIKHLGVRKFFSQGLLMVSNKLYVGNLNYKATSEDVMDLFGQYGEIKSVKLIEGKDETGRVIKKGFGFVEFEASDDAARAKEALSGAQFQNRALKVDFARPQEPREQRRF